MPDGVENNDKPTGDENGAVDKTSPEFLAAVREAAASDVAGLKQNRDAVLIEKRKLKEEYDAMKTKFAGLGEYDSLKAMVDRLENDEEAKLIAEGKMSEVLDKRTKSMRDDSEARVTAATTRITELETESAGLRSTIVTLQVVSSIDQASAKLECAPTAIPDIRRAAREMFTLNAETNEIEARTDGVVQMGPDGKTPLNPATWLEGQKKTSPHWWGASNGGGANGGVGVADLHGHTIANVDKMSGSQLLGAVINTGPGPRR